ncbi:uncharacterized protein LOC100199922 [Hydra vulgaris]|uniref:uncharacterized protein LOC100199922 n=1 Tax=Hydra vulgaris TaxID=6087 RepID=UPI0002B44095|nr:uncharacterized protein LOC100199922 [Hydra vulgaris]
MASILSDQKQLPNCGTSLVDSDPVILRCNQTLKLETAIEILNNTDQYKVIHKVPENPKGGDTFLLIPLNGEDSWKNDGYKWCHYGPKLVPGKNPTVQKRYYAAYMSNGKVSKFHKNVYQLINDERERVPVVVHYFGDHTIAAMRDSKKELKHSDKSVVSSEHQYSRYEDKKGTVHRAVKPKQQKKCILSKEDFLELHRIAYGLDSYVKLISHFPDLVIVFGSKEISDDLENLLGLNQEPRPLFSYSNSYELGDYVVSSFLFTHPAFLERPTIPSHFVIHEKTCGLAHQELCRILSQMVPSIVGSSNPVVLNLDPNKFSAISTVFPNMHTLFSWKDVIANTKAWLYANGASQQEVTVYIEDLRQLFSRRSKELYEEALVECKTRWHDFFEEYYMKEIHEVVNDRLGRWALEKWNVYNPYTGVTDKSNEGMEIVIRQLKVSGNSPVQSTVLSLCLLQRWLSCEISKSFCGVGPYTMRAEFQALQRNMDDINNSSPSCPPDQILFYIQNKQVLVAEGILKDDAENSEIKMNLQSAATQLLKAGAIELNSKQQTFTVKVNPVTYYEVSLFPKVSCSCLENRSGLCSHVLAVKMSLGINIEDDLRKYQPQRNIKSEIKLNSDKKMKREGSNEDRLFHHLHSKRSKEVISDEDVSIQSNEMTHVNENIDPEGNEAVDVDHTTTVLLHNTLDDATQLQNLLQMSNPSFQHEVGMNM